METGVNFPPKGIITLTESVMYPPESTDTPPTKREKPLGCKTIFVGYLPEKVTEEVIREIFELCGEISNIRMGYSDIDNNIFRHCHIRFTKESHVDNAIYLSGYKLKIKNRDDAVCSRISVDFANARDDLYEYERLQREARKEARKRKEALMQQEA